MFACSLVAARRLMRLKGFGGLGGVLPSDVNTKPIDARCFAVKRVHQRGGSAGFSVNGYLLSGKKR
jgi:hypothetical protein